MPKLTCGNAVAMVFAALALCVDSALAQTTTPPRIEEQFDRAFQNMLSDPANLDKTFQYAEIAIQAGDYEAAITALERMLLFNPDLPRVRLELGVLYFRLESYAIARAYLTRAVEGDNVPDDVRARVAVFLEEIDKRTSKHRYSGSIYAGFRYQDNANSAPERPDITVFGLPAILPGDFTRKNDLNAFGSGSLTYTYDPQRQDGYVFDADGLVYGAKHTSQQQLDLIFTEIKLGPRGPFSPDMIDDVEWRPYIFGEQVWLEDSPYLYAFGLGFNFSRQFTPGFAGELNLEHRVQEFSESDSRPTADDQDGHEDEARIDLRYQVRPGIFLSGASSIKVEDADESLHSNREFQLTLGYTQSYGAPFKLTNRPWTSSLNGTFIYPKYFAPDPTVDPNRNRSDEERRFSFLTSVPVTRDWSVIGTVQRTIVDSNFRNFSYNNTAFTIGASRRF